MTELCEICKKRSADFFDHGGMAICKTCQMSSFREAASVKVNHGHVMRDFREHMGNDKTVRRPM